MNKIILALRRPARLIIIISIAAYATFEFLATVAGMGGDFGSVLGQLLYLAALAGLIGGFVFAWVKRNDAAMRYIGIIMFAFWGVRAFYRLATGAPGTGVGALTAYYVFGFLAALCGVGVLGLAIAKQFFANLTAKRVVMIIEIALVASFVFFTLIEQFCFMGFAGDNGYGWGAFMDSIGQIMLLPAMLVGFVCLFVPESAIPAEEEPAESEEQQFVVEAEDVVLPEEPKAEEPAEEESKEE